MFTGIITGLGRITDVQALGTDPAHGKRLTLITPGGYLDDVRPGDSIAVNGACMTVTSIDAAASRFSVDVSAESLDKTAGLDAVGDVNLEKALRANDRLGGHLVSGHVDGIGHVTHFAPIGESWELRIAAPATLAKFLAYKGSITVDGVSLTVNRVVDTASGDGGAPSSHADATCCEFSLNLIPHTLSHTTLGRLSIGQPVNLEVDQMARYVERMLSLAAPLSATSSGSGPK